MARAVHFWCFVAVVVLAPVPLGSNRPAFWTVLAFLVGLLCVTWPFVVRRDTRRVPEPLVRLAPPLALFAAAWGWGLIQAIPGIPEAWANPVWGQVRAILPDAPALIAVDADKAVDGTMRLMTYAGVAFLAIQHGRSSRRAHLLVDAIAISGAALALYGLWVFVSGSQTILGMPKWAYQDSLTSTFVNRNSYAAFAGIGLLAALSACWRRMEPTGPLNARLLLHLGRPTVAYIGAAMILLIALPLTSSRAGTAASLIGVVAFVLAYWCAVRAQRRLVPWIVLAAVPVLAGGTLVWILAWSEAGAAMASDRVLVYGLAADFVADRPWLGHGLGSFAPLFRMHRPEAAVQVWAEAHNSYLELASDLGVPAALALLAAVAWLVAICVHALLRGIGEHEATALALAATILLGVHSMVDFSAQIPAVTVTWMAVLGTGVARAWRATSPRPPITFGMPAR